MEAASELGTVLTTDADHDGIIVLPDMPPGNYKFSVDGGNQTDAIYWVRTSCTSYDPTNAPSYSPYHTPTDAPSSAPSSYLVHTHDPTRNPTATPTPLPSVRPTAITASSSTRPETETTEGQNAPLNTNSGGSQNELRAVLVGSICVIGFTVFACVVVCVELYVYYRNKKGAQEEENTNPYSMDRILSMTVDSVRGEKQKQKANELKNEGNVLNVMPQNQVTYGVYMGESSSGSDSMCDRIEKQKLVTVGGNKNVHIHKDHSSSDCDDVVVGEGGYGLCVDCTKNKLGKVYRGNGLFYCDECWRCYE
eukprot:717827_1